MATPKKKLPTGISARGNGYRWSCMVDGLRRTGTSPSLEEAVQDRQAAINQLREAPGSTVTPSKAGKGSWTLKAGVDHVANLPAPEGWLGAKSEEHMLMQSRLILEYFGPSKKLDDIGKPDIDAFVAHLMKAKGNSNATVNRKLSVLHKVMKTAWRGGGLSHMPHFPKRLKEDNARDREISPEEESLMLTLMRNMGKEEQAEAVTVLIDTGMRNSELWSVQKRDIDFKSGLVMVYGKDGKGTKNGTFRSIPMSKRVREIMERRVKGAETETTRLFPYDNAWMRWTWDKTKSMMGLDSDDQFVPYICRHTCASRLVRGGAPIPVVQKWLGHKTIQMTMRYSHLMPTDLLQHVGAIEASTSGYNQVVSGTAG